MRTASLRRMVAAGFAAVTLAGCQSYVPRAEDPIRPVPLAASLPSTSSSQRLDEDGYPMIGAYPTAAGAQVGDDVVESTRERFAQTAARRDGRVSEAGYRRSVTELQALAARQRKDASAALTTNADISGLRNRAADTN